MITVLSGTDNPAAQTHIFAQNYTALLERLGASSVQYLSLAEIPQSAFFNPMYAKEKQAAILQKIQDDILIPSEKWVVVSPEYNGSYPGILKLFIDALSIRAYDATFSGKKIALVGVASGRAGNLRGMDHLAGIFNHLGAVVMPNKLPISSIGKVLDKERNIALDTQTIMQEHARHFLRFF